MSGKLPIVIDAGKTKKKWIKRLKRGDGKLAREVAGAVAAVEQELGDEAEGKILVPVVLVYRKKPKKRLAWPFRL
jgi:hypothetical protein